MTAERIPVGVYGDLSLEWWNSLPDGRAFTVYQKRRNGAVNVVMFTGSQAEDLYRILRERFEPARVAAQGGGAE